MNNVAWQLLPTDVVLVFIAVALAAIGRRMR